MDGFLAYQVGGSHVPTLMSDVAGMIDPTLREADNITEGIMRRVPFASQAVDARQNVFGADIQLHEGGPGGMAGRLLDPFASRAIPRGRVEDTLAAHEIRFPSARKGPGETEAAFRTRHRVEGSNVKSAARRLFTNRQFARLGKVEKQAALQSLSNSIRRYLRDNGFRAKNWDVEIERAVANAARRN